jgi:hypothetical protein
VNIQKISSTSTSIFNLNLNFNVNREVEVEVEVVFSSIHNFNHKLWSTTIIIEAPTTILVDAPTTIMVCWAWLRRLGLVEEAGLG